MIDYYIARKKRRVVEGGILALGDPPRAGRQDHRFDPVVEAKILAPDAAAAASLVRPLDHLFVRSVVVVGSPLKRVAAAQSGTRVTPRSIWIGMRESHL